MLASDSLRVREALAAYAHPSLGRSAFDIITSVVAYLAVSVLMYLALDVSYLLTLALTLPAAGFLVRTFVVFHDCAHGSFLPSKRANVSVGPIHGPVRALAVSALAPRSCDPSRERQETSSAVAWGTSSR